MLIGLVGKSCSGKNFVGDILSSAGVLVWDMDKMCHDGLYENLDAIKSTFGENVVHRSSSGVVVSRAEIGRIVFRDPSKRTALEDILYPWLKQKVLQWKSANPDGVLVINGALLYRSGFDSMCDGIVYVDAPYETRLARARRRDAVSSEDFERREAAQADVDFRSVTYRAPLYVIVNDGDNLDELNRQVFAMCDKFAIIYRRS